VKQPLITVVLPCYNRASTIVHSVQSVAQQEYENVEILLVDDGSSDNTEALVAGLNLPNLRYIKHEKNLGANAARNSGIAEARGELVAFQDSDDRWDSSKLSLQLEALQTHAAGIAFCAFERIHDGKIVRIPKPGYHVKPGCECRFESLLQGSYISCQTLIARRELLLEAGLFDEALPRLQDWDLCLRLAKRHPVVYVDEALVQVHVSSDSMTREASKLLLAASMILDKHAPDFRDHPQAAAMLCTNVAGEALRHGNLPGFLRFAAKAVVMGGVHYPAALRALHRRR